MFRKLTLAPTAALLMAGAPAPAPAPARAQSMPPDGALPLSEVIAQIEALEGLHFIGEVEWDDDGYREVE